MAKTVIPEGKHRYYITLSIENFEWLQHLVCTLGKQPKSQVSVFIDEMIGGMKSSLSPALEKYEKTGTKPTHADFLLMLGKELQKMGDDQPDLM